MLRGALKTFVSCFSPHLVESEVVEVAEVAEVVEVNLIFLVMSATCLQDGSLAVLATMKSCFEDLRAKTFQWGKKDF